MACLRLSRISLLPSTSSMLVNLLKTVQGLLGFVDDPRDLLVVVLHHLVEVRGELATSSPAFDMELIAELISPSKLPITWKALGATVPSI